MLKKIRTFIRKQLKKGQTLVEYGLIIALLAAVLIASLSLMKNSISNIFSKNASELESVSSN
ncbi:MAG: Flp family type IVb pilin [Verrucomicrobiota bacterium]